MKLPYRFRKMTGASTLVLICVCALGIILIGVAALFIGFLIGGNHQLNHASDAGILNSAKNGVFQPTVALTDASLPGQGTAPYSDFAVWTYPSSSSVSFDVTDAKGHTTKQNLRYITPRQIPAIAAQVILCMLNANLINTPTAIDNAKQLFTAFVNLERKMRAYQMTGGLNSNFDQVAGANNLNMLGGEAGLSRADDVKAGFAGVGKKLPVNLFFDNHVLSQFDSKSYTIPVDDKDKAVRPIFDNKGNIDTYDQNLISSKDNPSPPAAYYVAGYETLTISLGGTDYKLLLAPNNPQRKTHLIPRKDVADTPIYSGNSDANGDAVLPNAFYVTTNANSSMLGNKNKGGGSSGTTTTKGSGAGSSSNSHIVVNAIACAIEGVGGDGYIGCIPQGFIRIKNGLDMQTVANYTFPTGNEGAADNSKLIVNTYMLSPTNFVYVGMPIPFNKDGTLNTNKVIFAVSPNGLADIQTQISNNSSNNQQSVSTQNIYEGPNPGQLASSTDLAGLTGYVAFSDSTYDGSANLVNNGIVYSPDTIRQVINTCASNLGVTGLGDPGAPTGHLAFNEANGYTNGSGFTAIEFLKAKVINTFVANKAAGFEKVSAPSGTSGMGIFNFYDSNGNLKPIAVPNNYYHRKDPGSGTAKAEVPHVCQFEQPGTAYDYLVQIDNTIKNANGGSYPPGATTMNDFLNKILQIAQEINPNWQMSDLTAYLKGNTLSFGQTLYLYRDLPTGQMRIDGNLNYDNSMTPDGVGSKTIFKFSTPAIPLNHYTVNTSKWSVPDAERGDANVEAELWRGSDGDFTGTQSATFVPSSGYGQLLGEITFGEQVAGQLTYSNPN